jgi:tRNA(fMet)-specific endonuclease VapC
MCRIWGSVRTSRASSGRPISPQDAWVAATALRYNLALITHNASDYQDISNLRLSTIP